MRKKILSEIAVVAENTIADDILDILEKNNMECDTPCSGSSYIMPNGKFIDLQNRGFRTHGAFDDYIVEAGITEYDNTGLRLPIKYCNAVRCNNGANFFGEVVLELPPKPITADQISSISDWIDWIAEKSNLLTVTASGSQEMVDYDLLRLDGWDIAKRIKNYYTSGILHENLNENLTEGQNTIDPEGKFSDFGTGHVERGDDIFDDRTHVPFYDNLFTDPTYMREKENLVGHIEMLSPREYYQECADKIFNCSVSNLMTSRRMDDKVNSDIEEIITKYKRQVFLPYINYAEKGQEGLHRMLVAAKLFGWDHKFPVLIINWADEDRAKRRELAKYEEQVSRYIKNAVNKALKYEYKSYDEFKRDLKYYLDIELNYIDVTIDTYEVSHTEDTTTVAVNGIEYKFAKRAINLSLSDNIEDDEDLGNFEYSDEELYDIDNLSFDEFLKKYGG